MSGLEKINLWGYKKVEPYIGERILEAGCGNGNLTSYLLKKELVLAVDNDLGMLDEFKKRFGSYNNVKYLQRSLENFLVDDFLNYKLDTIICINTLEHVKEDVEVLNNFNKIINKGNLILLVPAFQVLYCPLDKAAGHYRRYNMKEISDKVEKCGFIVQEKMYFNFFGIIGWFFNGKILKKERLSNKLLGLFNYLLPIFSLFEKLTGPPIGLSIILICKKRFD